MDNSPIGIYAIDKFQVIVTKTDTELLIEAENDITGRTYSYKISSDNVPAATNKIFNDIQEMYCGLIEGMDKTTENIKISIDKKAVLRFQYTVMMGKLEKRFEFEIPLKEIEVDEITKLKKQLMKTNKKLAECQIELSEIRAIVSKDGYMKISPGFDANITNKQFFNDFKDQDKTITRNGTSNSNYYVIFAKEKLPVNGKYRFSIKIEKSTQVFPYIMIGVATANLKNSAVIYSSGGSYCLYLQNNCVYFNGQSQNCALNTIGQEGDIVSVCLDLDQKDIRFLINDYFVCRRRLHTNVDLYPCVHLFYNTDSGDIKKYISVCFYSTLHEITCCAPFRIINERIIYVMEFTTLLTVKGDLVNQKTQQPVFTLTIRS